jgi:hypothetical protein
MSTTVLLGLAVAFTMLVYIAWSARAIVRLRRARALVVKADVPECADASHAVPDFATLKQWYSGKDCGVCHRPIPPLHRVGPKPGLMRRAPGVHPVLTWNELPAGPTPLLLETYVPICSTCQIAESLREQFPDRMMTRPGHPHTPAPN